MAEAMEEQITNNPNNSEQQVGKTIFSLMDVREKYLRELQGRTHLPLNPRNGKIVRADIKDMYFFGQETTLADIENFRWI